MDAGAGKLINNKLITMQKKNNKLITGVAKTRKYIHRLISKGVINDIDPRGFCARVHGFASWNGPARNWVVPGCFCCAWLLPRSQ
jgi:hypothetical protein